MSGWPWWLGMPPIESEIDCQGSCHRIVWQDGQLHLLDHDDPEGERLLVALGAEAVGCHEVAASWAEHARDVRVLAVGPRAAPDRLQLTSSDLAEVGRHMSHIAAGHKGRWVGRAAARLAAQGTQGRPGSVAARKPFAFRSLGLVAGILASGEAGWRSQVGLLELFTLRRALIDRLQLEVWTARSGELRDAAGHPDAEGQIDVPGHGTFSRDRPALVAAAMARVRASAVIWLAGTLPRAFPEVRVTLVGEGAVCRIEHAQPARAGRGSLSLTARAGADWVGTVAARQMAVVDGHLVTELLATGTTARVRALAPPSPLPAENVEIALVRNVAADTWTIGS